VAESRSTTLSQRWNTSRKSRRKTQASIAASYVGGSPNCFFQKNSILIRCRPRNPRVAQILCVKTRQRSDRFHEG